MIKKSLSYCAAFCCSLIFAQASMAAALPSKMIFFAEGTACPAGSTAAADAAGRMLLVTTNVGDVGKTFGTALKDQEDRTHTHSGTMTVNLPSHHISGASSCCNSQATSKGSHSQSVTSGASTSGLPFIQLLVCQAN
ncbi:hypothetical protein [Endozoicomonas arenosclerae]|uniref:hypothetical protein n=1 Tax=Endozoicomonas arenosclerae TaxID=1633495 RepID=UPI0007822415|nr:hypothetical protein [Endozoicomonas arenosclerae]